jgi:hypothetical protein
MPDTQSQSEQPLETPSNQPDPESLDTKLDEPIAQTSSIGTQSRRCWQSS